MSIASDFKEFAIKGNAVDMAVGLVVGAAFTKIINSLVTDIIMPPIGMLLGGVDFKDLAIILKEPTFGPGGLVATPAVAVNYGLFINNIIDFLIVSFSIFMVVRLMSHLIKKRSA